jgi:hypothetical protein
MGYNGEEASNNLIWNESEGFILFSTKKKVIFENLNQKEQFVVYEGTS